MKPLPCLLLAIIGATITPSPTAGSSAPLSLRAIEDSAAAGVPGYLGLLRDSAEVGNREAMNFLGYLYWSGTGVPVMRDSALVYLENGVRLGDARAMANLGHIVLHAAPGDPVEPDTALALDLLAEGARRRSIAAARELADYYAIHSGDSAAARHLRLLGDLTSRGSLLPYSHKGSIRYYQRAAELGDTLAQRYVTELLEIFPDALKE